MELKRILNKKTILIIFTLCIMNCIWFYRLNIGTEESELIQYHTAQQEYINQYETEIQNIIDNSESMLSLNIFKNSSTFVRNNLLKTRYDFIQLKNIPVKSGSYFGFTKAFQYSPTFFICLIGLFIIISSFIEEKKNGLSYIIHSSKYGRMSLTIKRFFILVFFSLFITFLYESSIFTVGIKMFQDSFEFSDPVQSIQEFKQCILHINVIQFVLIRIVVDSLVLLLFAMIFWVLMELIHSRNFVILIYSIIVIIEFLIYRGIGTLSTINILKYCNIAAIFKLKDYVFSYSNFGLFGWITKTSNIIIIFSIVIIITILLTLILNSMKSDVRIKKFKSIEIISNWITRQIEKVFVRLPIFLMEIHKQLITQRGWLIIAIAMCALSYSMISAGVSHNEVQSGVDIYYKEVAQVYSKEEYTSDYIHEIDLWIINAKQELSNYIENNNVYRTQLLSNEIEIQNQIRNEIEKEQKYREEQNDNGINCGIITQPEYQSVTGHRMDSFEENNAIIALITVIVTTFGLIAYEKKNNTLCIIKSSKTGYKKYLIIKICVLFILTGIIWLLLYGVNFLNLLQVYNLSIKDFRYPIQSIMTMSSYPLHISIGVYFILKNLIRFMILFFVALLGLLISIKTSYKNCVFLFALIFIPFILDSIGIPVIKYISAVYWMKVC